MNLIARATFALSIVWACGLHPGATPAHAAWPERNVTVVVPYPAGGIADTLARLYSERLQAKFKQSFVVENTAGASGLIASNRVRRAPADGYTLYFATTPQLSVLQHMQKLEFDPQEAFIGIAPGAQNAFIFTVSETMKINTLPELIALAKSKPGTITFGTAGLLSFSNMTARIFERAAGIEMRGVSYRGLAPAFQDLIAGHINLISASPNEVSPLLSSGKVRALAATAKVETKVLPKIPSIKAFVPTAPELISWQGILAAKGTPAPIIQQISAEFLAAAKDPAFLARLERYGLEPFPITPEQFKTYLAEESKLWQTMIDKYNLRAN